MPSPPTRTSPEQLYRLLADSLGHSAGDELLRALGVGVPEGVETDGQLQRLAALGCDHAQGFLLSRPLPADGPEALLRGDG